MNLAGYAKQLQERDGMSPDVLHIMGDLHTLERRDWMEQDRARAQRVAGAARARIEAADRAEHRHTTSKRELERALAGVYKDPQQPMNQIEHVARTQSAEAVAAHLRGDPEHFGELKGIAQRRFLILRTDRFGQARERARGAAELARVYGDALAGLPSREVQIADRVELEGAERRVRYLTEALRNLDRGEYLARIGARARSLGPEKALRSLTAPQQKLMGLARTGVERMLPDQVQELTRWALAPQKQIPASVVKAFKAAFQDRDRDRGIG